MHKFFTCFLTVAVGLFAHSPAFALKNENLLVGMPTGYKIAYQTREKNMKMTEMVPKNQTVKNWSEMLTVQIFLNDKKQTPIGFYNRMSKGFARACKGSTAKLIKKGTENGYAFSFFLLICRLNPKTNKPEYTWFKSIRGKDSFYVVQKSWRKAPTKRGIVSWSKFLRKVSVCDTRISKRPCPSN